jgi:hypothetical protein
MNVLHRDCLDDRSSSYSETSVNVYETTRHNIPEDSLLHTRSRENLKSQRLQYLKTFMHPVLLDDYLLLRIREFFLYHISFIKSFVHSGC